VEKDPDDPLFESARRALCAQEILGMSESKPLLFISHKHSDHAIAQVVAQFITDKSRGDVDIHLSSDPGFEGPRFGPGLNEKLKRTLWNSDALILVYTSEDQDWSYCMWECGVAQQPQSPETNIVVFQCWTDIPKPFAADLRVNAANLDHIQRFTKQLMKDPTFFPRRNVALAPNYPDSTWKTDSQELFDKLAQVLPGDSMESRVQQWTAWPYLRIEVPIQQIETIIRAVESERKGLACQVIRDHGVVVEGDARAAELFGLTDLAPRHMFKELLKTWSEKFPGVDAIWFESCCEQILVGAQRQFPVICWAPLRKVGSESDFIPVISRTRVLPFAGVMQFGIYFYNLSDPQAVPVTHRMLRTGDFLAKSLGQISPESVMLKDLLRELATQGRNRVPIVSNEGHLLYIIHRSMIEQFISNRVLFTVDEKGPGDFTLADLLADSQMKRMFESTFAVVHRRATLAEAKTAMLATPSCLDVFVTAGGRRDEPILGWLTNRDIDKGAVTFSA
jgi:hypothetical protein